MNLLKMRGRLQGALATLLLGCLSVSAQAETVTQKLFESTTLVTGTSMNLTEFDFTTPGTLVIELDDLKWPSALDVLSFSLTDATHVLKTFTADSTATKNIWTFDVAGPGTFYGGIFAKPSAATKAGLYYANISYQSVSTVPLPMAAWFMISGIAGLAAFRPKHKLSQI